MKEPVHLLLCTPQESLLSLDQLPVQGQCLVAPNFKQIQMHFTDMMIIKNWKRTCSKLLCRYLDSSPTCVDLVQAKRAKAYKIKQTKNTYRLQPVGERC